MEVLKEQFEIWVREAIDGLPERFLKHMNNVVIFVEDYPTGEQIKKAGLKPGQILFGLYEGYHQSMKLNVGTVLPDKITIFRRPICQYYFSEEEIKRQVVETVKHEIAHHFGAEEEGARRAGKRKNF